HLCAARRGLENGPLPPLPHIITRPMEPTENQMDTEKLAPTDIVKLPFTFDPLALQADLARIQPEEWIRHFNDQIFEGDWSGVALRSVGGTTAKIYSGLNV